nr:biotin carboxylase N-terminal domain-containing protein [uncultured Brevundimonas sp.]
MKRIDKVLIANRGEIAIRVARTCRDMGIATVAVYSDADEGSPHVEIADEAVRIGPPPAIESYLSIERIVAAARRTSASAIHPGYGFLAENADFARACGDAGIVFIGPSPEVIRALGSKRESKRIAREAGVPVIPGDDDIGDRDLEALSASASNIGFPVLIKASAGGGGKGMRIVREPQGLEAALASARREAKSAFGDDTLLIEKYIDKPRHIEIQILGDAHGNVIHLYERECSIQRRHQKIIEETPSPAIDDPLRQSMGEAAVALGKAVGYEGAGTVEFILAPDQRFYFLEVNTRLQVEHPITECITGIDLVREQIRIARGQRLELGAVPRSGAAIECRLYAEDPSNGFLPASGQLVDWHVPPELAEIAGVRIDGGVRAGQEIAIHYDPMLAKLICHGPSREETIQTMLYLLRGMSVQGIANNRAFLARVLDHEAFRNGDFNTHFLDTFGADLAISSPDDEAIASAAVAAALAGHESRRRSRAILPDLEPGFRNNRFADEHVEYEHADGRVIECRYRNLGAGKLQVSTHIADSEPGAGDNGDGSMGVEVVAWRDPILTLEDEHGWRRRFRVVSAGDRVYVHTGGVSVALRARARFPDSAQRDVSGGLTAPMPGKVVKVLVSPGQAVASGDAVAILEAMKMEHVVRAPQSGLVSEVAVSEGEQVDADQLIAVVVDEVVDQSPADSSAESSGDSPAESSGDN